jgi:DNA-binding protein H-NS
MENVMDLKSLNLKELKKLEAEVKGLIASYEDRKLTQARAELEAKAKELGFSRAELLDGQRKSRKASSPVAAKYAHPQNASVTWSGRGRKPKWVEEALAAGRSLSDLTV